MKQCNLVSENIYRIQVRRVLEVCCCTVRLYDISDVCLNTTNRGRDKNNVMPFKTFKITPTLTLPGHWPAKASQFHKNISIFWKNLHLHLHLSIVHDLISISGNVKAPLAPISLFPEKIVSDPRIRQVENTSPPLWLLQNVEIVSNTTHSSTFYSESFTTQLLWCRGFGIITVLHIQTPAQ